MATFAPSSLMLANITDQRRVDRATGHDAGADGDLFDRGDDTQAVFKLFAALERSAAAAGLPVLRLLGNHCVMNLVGDTRYVSRADPASFSGAARARALAADGEIGAWLLGAGVPSSAGRCSSTPACTRSGTPRLRRHQPPRRAGFARAVPRAGGEPQPAFAPMLSAADGRRGLAEGDEAERARCSTSRSRTSRRCGWW